MPYPVVCLHHLLLSPSIHLSPLSAYHSIPSASHHPLRREILSVYPSSLHPCPLDPREGQSSRRQKTLLRPKRLRIIPLFCDLPWAIFPVAQTLCAPLGPHFCESLTCITVSFASSFKSNSSPEFHIYLSWLLQKKKKHCQALRRGLC